jgi:hypothetical protein
MPNSLTPLIVQGTLGIGGAVLEIAGKGSTSLGGWSRGPGIRNIGFVPNPDDVVTRLKLVGAGGQHRGHHLLCLIEHNPELQLGLFGARHGGVGKCFRVREKLVVAGARADAG